MAEGKRANYVQVHMKKTSRRNRDGWNRSMNMGLDLPLLTMETGTSPETHVPGQSRPHKLGGEKSPIGTNPKMRGTMKELKQFLAEFQKHERAKRTRRHVTEQGVVSEGNRNQAEGGRRLDLRD